MATVAAKPRTLLLAVAIIATCVLDIAACFAADRFDGAIDRQHRSATDASRDALDHPAE